MNSKNESNLLNRLVEVLKIGLMSLFFILVIASVLALLAISHASAPQNLGQSLTSISSPSAPIVISTTEAPILFKMDGQPTLFYEIYVSNFSDLQPTKLEVLDQDGQVIYTQSGSALNDTLMAPHYGVEQTTVRLMVELGDHPIPSRISHRLYFANSPLVAEGASTPVIVKPLPVISPPLRPANWMAANAPSNLNPHRSAIFEFMGNRYLAERFAIDWIIEDANGSTHRGNGSLNSDYYAYGQDLLAVADGTVVGVWDGVPDSEPGAFPPMHILTLGGNYVVLDMHNGYYAFYAHLIPGSLRVKNGDNVTAGQVLGELGSSGNSNAPHLHFHICDSMDYILCHGQPYILANYSAGQMYTPDRKTFISTPAYANYSDSMPSDADGVHWADTPPVVNPQAYAVTSDDMPGYQQIYFETRNRSDVFEQSLTKGWKGGFFTGYNDTIDRFGQFISIYARENISKIFNTSDLGENETLIPAKKFGEWSTAVLFKDGNDTGMNLAFYKGEVYETIYALGNNTSRLEWFAQKAYDKFAQRYAITAEEMQGFNQTFFTERNTTGLANDSIEMGWKSGFSAGYNNTTDVYEQYISIYPRENISRVFGPDDFEVNDTVISAKSFGDWSKALSFSQDGKPALVLVFYKGDVFETLYSSGNSTSNLEWFAQKAYDKLK